jgi:hypothetical protein
LSHLRKKLFRLGQILEQQLSTALNSDRTTQLEMDFLRAIDDSVHGDKIVDIFDQKYYQVYSKFVAVCAKFDKVIHMKIFPKSSCNKKSSRSQMEKTKRAPIWRRNYWKRRRELNVTVVKSRDL